MYMYMYEYMYVTTTNKCSIFRYMSIENIRCTS